MASAVQKKLVQEGRDRVLARNHLVIICSKKAAVPVARLEDLARPDLRLVIADQSVPCGRYTLAMLDAAAKDPAYGADFKSRVLSRVMSGESAVKAVVAKVRLGEADAGIVYATDVTRQAAADVTAVEIPPAFNQLAVYPIAVLAQLRDPDLAGRFVDFACGPDGQKVLASFGFIAPGRTTQP